MRARWLSAVVLAACGEKAVDMQLKLPADQDQWDTSCTQTIEVYTEGANYPEQSGDYVGQTLDVSEHSPATYRDVAAQVRGRFDVQIPDSGLKGVEMYGWDGPSGFFDQQAFPELVFFSRVVWDGGDTLVIPLTPNLDCRKTAVTVRPIELVTLVTTKSCAMASAAIGANPFVSIGTLTPGLFKEYLFGWGGKYGAPVTDGVATFESSTVAGQDSCMAIYAESDTAYSGACKTEERACATGAEMEAVMLDNGYAQSLDAAIQEDFKGGVVGAVLDAQKAPIIGATVSIPADKGKVVYVDLDTTNRRLVATPGTVTSASGMFIVYTNELVDAKVSVNQAGTVRSKTVRVGAVRTFDDGFKAPAGIIVSF